METRAFGAAYIVTSTEARDKEADRITTEWIKHQDTHEHLMRCEVCADYMRRIVDVLERETD